MRFSTTTVSAWTLAATGAVALCGSTTSAFAPSRTFVGRSTDALSTGVPHHKAGCSCPACSGLHKVGCPCPACTSRSSSALSLHKAGCACPACTSRSALSLHKAGCACPACTSSSLHSVTCACSACAARTSNTRLYSDATGTSEIEDEAAAEDIPIEVAVMDGIESNDELHNEERKNNRGSLQKHKRDAAPSKGKPLSELEEGSTVSGKVKTIASYGAFVDIGAQSDGLLHISRMSDEFVSNVNDLVEIGQEIQVRIASVDSTKGQVALSMMSEEAEANAKEAQQQRPKRQGGGGGGRERRDDSKVCAALVELGWDTNKFVDGKVLSTLDFGAFVKINGVDLNDDLEGELDGLVHISALTPGRASSVTSVVNVGDKVQVRVKSIDGTKVSLSMISAEEEKESRSRRGGRDAPAFEGAKDWKESLEKFEDKMPAFVNGPLIVDNRK